MTFVPYANTGPFTNNVVPPGISATFLNNVESFLGQIVSSAVAGSGITASGTGNLAVGGTLGVTGIQTNTGNIVANGGMNINTIRDNNTGATVLDMSNPTTTSGTAGTFTVNTEVWGPKLKILHIGFAAYTDTATHTITLPSTFVRGKFWIGGFGNGSGTDCFTLQLSGTPIGVETITGLPASGSVGGSTANGVTTMYRNTEGNVVSSVNQVKVGTAATASNGSFILVGA